MIKKWCVFGVTLLLTIKVVCWEDDLQISLDNPQEQFPNDPGFGYLAGGVTNVRLARFLFGDEYHGWRGGIGGDVALLSYKDRMLWHMGLAMDSLADDQNEIHFRLVEVFYRASTGVKLRLGAGVLEIGYQHRCTHGSDAAVDSRITIKSGPEFFYDWRWSSERLEIGIRPFGHLYIVGQNRDLSSQPLGGLGVLAQAIASIKKPVSVILSTGALFEIVGQGYQSVYLIFESTKSVKVAPLFAARAALRVNRDNLKNDYGLHFAQNLDSGFGDRAQKTNTMSFFVEFHW